MDFGFEAGDEFAVGVDEVLLGFDFGDDGLLFGKWRVGKINHENHERHEREMKEEL